MQKTIGVCIKETSKTRKLLSIVYICFSISILLFTHYKNNIKRYNLYQEVHICDLFFHFYHVFINLIKFVMGNTMISSYPPREKVIYTYIYIYIYIYIYGHVFLYNYMKHFFPGSLLGQTGYNTACSFITKKLYSMQNHPWHKNIKTGSL